MHQTKFFDCHCHLKSRKNQPPKGLNTARERMHEVKLRFLMRFKKSKKWAHLPTFCDLVTHIEKL